MSMKNSAGHDCAWKIWVKCRRFFTVASAAHQRFFHTTPNDSPIFGSVWSVGSGSLVVHAVDVMITVEFAPADCARLETLRRIVSPVVFWRAYTTIALMSGFVEFGIIALMAPDVF